MRDYLSAVETARTGEAGVKEVCEYLDKNTTICVAGVGEEAEVDPPEAEPKKDDYTPTRMDGSMNTAEDEETRSTTSWDVLTEDCVGSSAKIVNDNGGKDNTIATTTELPLRRGERTPIAGMHPVDCHETASKTGVGGTLDAHKVKDYASGCPAVTKAPKLEPLEDCGPAVKPCMEV